MAHFCAAATDHPDAPRGALFRRVNILRQRDPALKEAVEASLAGEVEKAFDKLGSNVAEVKADNIAGAVAARWLKAFARAAGEHWRDGAES